jgi:DNA-directed RNA polymerase specialized sigma24 family protein
MDQKAGAGQLETACASDRDAPEMTPSRRLRRRLGSDGVAQLVAGYEGGSSVRELAARHEASMDATLRLLHEEGINTARPEALTDAQRKEIIRRYQAGESTYQIAAATGVPKTTVARTLQRVGITLRPRGRPATG